MLLHVGDDPDSRNNPQCDGKLLHNGGIYSCDLVGRYVGIVPNGGNVWNGYRFKQVQVYDTFFSLSSTVSSSPTSASDANATYFASNSLIPYPRIGSYYG